MNQYELTLVFKPELTEKETDAIIDKLGVEVTSRQQWGKRLLAYPIKSQKEGVYVHTNLSADASVVKKIDQKLTLNENVIRHLLVKGE